MSPQVNASRQNSNRRHSWASGSIPRPAGGFTLVELLVSIVIVVALAALVFALGGKAVSRAELANKTTIYRQHFVAAGLYSADNNGRVCPARDIQGWQGILVPYLMGDETPVNAESKTSEHFVDPFWENFNPKKPWVTGVGINHQPGPATGV